MLLAGNTNIVDNTNQYLKTNTIGDKRFELSNHLGNFNDAWVLIDKTLSGMNPNRVQEVRTVTGSVTVPNSARINGLLTVVIRLSTPK